MPWPWPALLRILLSQPHIDTSSSPSSPPLMSKPLTCLCKSFPTLDISTVSNHWPPNSTFCLEIPSCLLRRHSRQDRMRDWPFYWLLCPSCQVFPHLPTVTRVLDLCLPGGLLRDSGTSHSLWVWKGKNDTQETSWVFYPLSWAMETPRLLLGIFKKSLTWNLVHCLHRLHIMGNENLKS